MNSATPWSVHTGRDRDSKPARHLPRLNIDLDDIRDRYTRMLATTDSDERWAARWDLSFDVSPLVREVDRLYLLLLEARRRLADLEAAAWATVYAYADGEPHHLSYLQDELDHLAVIGVPDFPRPHPDDDQDDNQDDNQDADDDRDDPEDGPAGPAGGGGR